MIELWDGGESNAKQQIKRVRYNDNSLITQHVSSQADYVEPSSNGGFPPQPIVQSKGYDHMMAEIKRWIPSLKCNITCELSLGSSLERFNYINGNTLILKKELVSLFKILQPFNAFYQQLGLYCLCFRIFSFIR
jgi:hypothetical protein